MLGGTTTTRGGFARFVAVLAALIAAVLLQGALCSDGAAAAGAPCAPLFAAEPAHSHDECAPGTAQPSQDASAADPGTWLTAATHHLGHADGLDGVAGLCAALLAVLLVLIRRHRAGSVTAPPRPLPFTPPGNVFSATTPRRRVLLCVSRT